MAAYKKLAVFLLVFAAVFTLAAGFAPSAAYAEGSGAVAQIIETRQLPFTRTVYTDFLSFHASEANPAPVVEIDALNPDNHSNTQTTEDIDGYPALIMLEGGYAEWYADIPERGLYNIYIEYYPIPGRGVDIERSVLINGETPFFGAETITLPRVWTDAASIGKDNRGNEIRPSQIEAPRWEATYFMDPMGYAIEPLLFFFSQGVNTLRLESINEHAAIKRLVIKNREKPLPYEDKLRLVYENSGKAPEGYINIVEAETAKYRSSPTLHAISDRSSPGTTPYSVDEIRMNMIGGIAWRIPGQWIEWEIEVPSDGLYNITFKSRQNYNRGNVSVRRLTINGEVPFLEVEELSFAFSGDWQNMTLGNDGEPFLFPLTAGVNTIRLEVTLGGMGGFLSETEQIVHRLTASYRKLLVLIGTTPDPNRDYQVHIVFPEVLDYFRDEIVVLNSLVSRVTEYTGQKGDQIAGAQTLAARLTRFANRPEIIPRSLAGFRTEIGALAAFILRMSEGPLDIDQIIITSPDTLPPKTGTGFFARIIHELRMFLSSFFIDFSSIGSVYEGDITTLDIWILSGRDQAQSLKAIIDDTFTPRHQIGVNLRIIAQNVLLPAVVAGTGPDIALQVPGGDPVNFALRSSAVDLTGMPGFNDVKSNFFDSSFVPFMFDGGVYALPETQGFPVLFYRIDVLSELGLAVPNTWEDVINALPVLQKNNMDFGLATDDLLSMYGMFLNMLYQRGSLLYEDDHSKTLLDSGPSVSAFDFLTTLYTNHGLPKIFVFADRFRTGEMPMGIMDYGMFNHLSVSAPEIRGLWDFTVIPGYLHENGEINRSSTGGGTASMMLTAAKDQAAAWEFLKWWVGAETQARFGRELESLIGSAARYNTANINAFNQLPWSARQRGVLLEQWGWVVGTPEVPGGYYTSRHTLNALRSVMNNNEEPRETLLDYTRRINRELAKKRAEFGLN